MNGTGWPATCRPAPNTAAPHRPEAAWTRSCPGPRKDAPAVVPPGILARVPARNPGSPQSRPMPLRCMTPRVTPSCPQHRNTIPRVPRLLTLHMMVLERRIGRETVDSASGPASPVLTGYGHRVGSLGPGLTSESADAVRAVLRDDLSAGPRFTGTCRRCRPDPPGLD